MISSYFKNVATAKGWRLGTGLNSVYNLLNKYNLILVLTMFLLVGAVWMGLLNWTKFRNPKIDIEWTTVSELTTVGFNIYRSLEPDSHFALINEALIPSGSDSFVGNHYQYIDTNVVPGQSYYYILEEVDTKGIATRQAPIQARARRFGVNELLMSVVFLVSALLGIRFLLHRRNSREKVV